MRIKYGNFQVIVLTFVVLLLQSGKGIRWLALHKSEEMTWSGGGGEARGPDLDCEAVRHLLGQQAEAEVTALVGLCESSPAEVGHVVEAARLAVSTCQSLFKHRRWNCSNILHAGETPDLHTGTREQAVVYALSSAALLYTVARACATGASPHCGCAAQPKGRSVDGGGAVGGAFKWGGCGDNTRHGVRFTRHLTDRFERRRYRARNSVNYRHGRDRAASREVTSSDRDMSDTAEEMFRHPGRVAHDDTLPQIIALVNLHNNKIGRRAVTGSVATQCKCHGVSGSCNVKTCWRAVSGPFEGVVGQQLLGLYPSSVEMRRGRGVAQDRGHAHQLVYVTKSPDYCIRDDKTGSTGTSGRECNATASDASGCSRMCCGRGYRSRVVERVERCHCKHVWCCHVQCKTCTTFLTVNTCV